MEPALWNIKNLPPPPTINWKANIREIDLKMIKSTLNDASEYFEGQKELHKEAALLSRLIYRMKTKYRTWAFFKSAMKLNQVLLRYLNMNIKDKIKKFLHSLPQFKPNQLLYLPSKHHMDFLLINFQGLGQLLMRTLEVCKMNYMHINNAMRIGHSWKSIVIVCGVAARVFVITKHMLKYTCDLYSNLEPYTSKLPDAGQNWLPENYKLPKLLNEWLNIDWLDLDKTVIEIPDEEPASFFLNLVDSDEDDDDIEIIDEYIVVGEESPKKPTAISNVEPDIDDYVHTMQIQNVEEMEFRELNKIKKRKSNTFSSSKKTKKKRK